MSDVSPRISGRIGLPVRLDVSFFRNGVLTSPYAIRRVEIYKASVRPDNLLETIELPDPDDSTYPSPVEQDVLGTGSPAPGKFFLDYDVPTSFEQDIYFDKWVFLPECDVGTGSECDLDDEDILQSICNKFFLFPDSWFASDNLEIARIGFEFLDFKLVKPEKRTIEVGLQPLPLYDFSPNLILPLIPHLTADITIETDNCELLVDGAPMTIGLRQGSYRTNPYTLQYEIDTGEFLAGTYRYKVKLTLPNGQTRVSPVAHFTIVR